MPQINSNLALRDLHHDYRRIMQVRAETPQENGDLILIGTPVIFDQEYKLFDWFKKEVFEIIEAGAFDGADYTDVPLKYNHGDSKGVPARTTCMPGRGKLDIIVGAQQVDVRMNLLHTNGGKDLYMEVAAGAVPQMSWAFTIAKDGQVWEETDTRILIRVKKVKRVFDVSAVDFGANPQTNIYARRLSDLDERAKQLDERKRQALISKIQLKIKI